MHNRHARFDFERGVLGFGCLMAVACGPDSIAPGSGVSNDVGSVSEDLRVQAFLEARYTKADVWHTFETNAGQTIDCIDYYAHPGVKALLASGDPMLDLSRWPQKLENPHRVRKAASPPRVNDTSSLPDYMFNGRLDEAGRPRACPQGSVPMVRITPEHIRNAGGLDAYARLMTTKAPPPETTSGSGAPEFGKQDFAHVLTTATGTIRYAGTVTSVDFPKVPNAANYHSISQLWALTGTQNTPCSGSACKQTIEAGWSVDPQRFHTDSPVFFTFSTADGYNASGCYNNDAVIGPKTCLPWVPGPTAPIAPGTALSFTSSGRNELVLIVANFDGLGWALYAGDYNAAAFDMIGGWPYTDYSGQFQTSATSFQVGGETEDPSQINPLPGAFLTDMQTFVAEMGSGAMPTSGYSSPGSSAAYHRSYFACPTTAANCTQLPFGLPSSTVSSSYGYASGGTPPGAPDWGNYFYFGNNEHPFSGGSYPPSTAYGFSSWATSPPAGSYRAECPFPRSLTGISQSPTTHVAQGIHCGTTYWGPANADGCTELSVDTADKRRTNDNGWDWDPGYVKVECGANEYIQGVSQSTQGVLNAVLCCPATTRLNRQNLGAALFYSGDGGFASEHDWDVGYYKGICAPTRYMSGISKVYSNSQGVAGRIHAILCGG